MLTVNEIDGFHTGDQVKIIRVFLLYDQEFEGQAGTIDHIAAKNKVDCRIAVRVDQELIYLNSDQIEHI